MFPELDLPGDRDAQAALEGYLYQFKLTLLRWFELGENDVLLPETGEDLLLWQAGLSGESPAKALLEQVKKRSRSITLSSTDARASLAHCYAHMRANPKEALRFRFITNAKIGREKRIEGGIPGITLWQQVQVGDAKSAVYVRRLRKTLTGANRPDDVSSNEWALWQAFVASATDAEFTDFVCRYEWSCGFERIEDLDDRLRIALSSLSPTSLTREQALARGQSLLANLFERLTRPRPRTLTRADLLKTLQRANSTEALPFFWALVATKTFEQPPLSGTERRALTGKLAPTHLVPSPSQVSIVEQPPPIGARAVTRAKAISSIESRLSSDRWVNLSGAPGMGKTALVPRHRGFDRLERG